MSAAADPALAFADFHVHTRFSPDSRLAEDRLLDLALERGLTHLAVTDHDTLAGALAAQQRASQRGLQERLRIIVGEEVSSADGEIIGLFLREQVQPGRSAEATADAIREQGGLVSIPHPFDPFRRSHIRSGALDRLADTHRIDMVEIFNSRVTFTRHNLAAAEFAARHGLPGIATSDSHTGFEVAMSFNALATFETATELRRALAHNEWHGTRTTKLVHLGTRYAAWSKAVLRRAGRGS